MTEDVRSLAAADPRVERNVARVAALHGDALGIDAELGGEHALDHRMLADARLDGAGVDGEPAIGLHGDEEARRAAGDVPRAQRDAAAAAGRERRVPVHRLA